ncbi:MAG TPA: DUF1330 domain-containing protein [Steroidobacteraceae bacterium]|jgi:uncharacterized protein (DUF1330 family)|nr:DUF1330 domain-containing protein [Steroidobacteraceae bacterium]
MAKGYWIVCYREVRDALKVAAYGKLAVPAIEAGGGKILARGTAVKAFEAGQLERTVVIEFPSVEKAIAAYNAPEYQAAVKVLAGGAVRDLRVVPGV